MPLAPPAAMTTRPGKASCSRHPANPRPRDDRLRADPDTPRRPFQMRQAPDTAQVGRGFRIAQARGEALRTDPDARSRAAGVRPNEVEAREWFSGELATSILAMNRFGTSERGLAFIEELYAAGAREVLVSEDAVEVDSDAGVVHADTLVVRLPADTAARARVFGIINREARSEGFDEEVDEGQEDARLWWD